MVENNFKQISDKSLRDYVQSQIDNGHSLTVITDFLTREHIDPKQVSRVLDNFNFSSNSENDNLDISSSSFFIRYKYLLLFGGVLLLFVFGLYLFLGGVDKSFSDEVTLSVLESDISSSLGLDSSYVNLSNVTYSSEDDSVSFSINKNVKSGVLSQVDLFVYFSNFDDTVSLMIPLNRSFDLNDGRYKFDPVFLKKFYVDLNFAVFDNAQLVVRPKPKIVNNSFDDVSDSFNDSDNINSSGDAVRSSGGLSSGGFGGGAGGGSSGGGGSGSDVVVPPVIEVPISLVNLSSYELLHLTFDEPIGTYSSTSPTIQNDCVIGRCYYFDGIDFVDFYNSSFGGFNNFSIYFWAKPESLSTLQYPVWFDNFGLIEFGSSSISSMRVKWSLDNFWSSRSTSVDNVLEEDVWSFWAVTFDNGNTSIYKDGSLIASGVDSRKKLTVSSVGTFYIGFRGFYGGFVGRMDEFVMLNKTLSSNEIESLYDFGTYQLSKGPINSITSSSFNFDETSGNVLIDNNYFNNANLVGTVSRVSHESGNALYFDGGYALINSPDVSKDITSTLSISVWVKPSVLTDEFQSLVVQDSLNGNESFGLYIDPQGDLVGFRTKGPAGGPTTDWLYAFNQDLFDCNWHHILATYDGAMKSIYLDGERVAQVSATGNILSSAGGDISIGSRKNNGIVDAPYFGLMDDLIISSDIVPNSDTFVYAFDNVSDCSVPDVSYGLWYAQYFDDITFSNEVLSRWENTNVSYNWGTGSPDSLLPVDSFSARWTGDFDFDGTYDFIGRSDDSIKLIIDGEVIFNCVGTCPPFNTASNTATKTLYGTKTVVVEFIEKTGGASVSLKWEKQEEILQPNPVESSTDSIVWNAKYFNNPDFRSFYPNRVYPSFNDLYTPVFSRTENELNHDWGTGSPDSSVDNDYFSARYTTDFYFNGSYSFQKFAENFRDAISVRVDNNVVFNCNDCSLPFGDVKKTFYGNKTIVVDYAHELNSAKFNVNISKLNYIIPLYPTDLTWRAQYFASNDFTNLISLEDVSNIDYDWGYRSPDVVIPDDSFSVKWTSEFDFNSTYEFAVSTINDFDSISLSVDGVTLVDCPNNCQYVDLHNLATDQELYGTKTIIVEYIHTTGQAGARLHFIDLNYDYFSEPEPPLEEQEPDYNFIVDETNALSSVWNVEYFNDISLSNSVLTKQENSKILYDWGTGSPDPLVNSDSFSVRWSGTYNFDGSYNFSGSADDDMMVLIDNNPFMYCSGQCSMRNKALYGVKTVEIEYTENSGNANVKFGMIDSGFPDDDRDGFDTSQDCDDSNPYVNPDAQDFCGDSFDSNCSGDESDCTAG